MARVTGAEVKEIFETDLAATAVDKFIVAPNLLITQLASASASFAALGVAMLKQIELYLSAHFVSAWDQRLTKQKFGDSSADFQVNLGDDLKSTVYGQLALSLDTTGTLLSSGKRPMRIDYLGKV